MAAQNNNVISKVKVAAIQSPSIMGNIDANIKLFTQQIKIAAKQGAKIIVLPEAAITGYSSQDFLHSWCTKDKSRHLGSAFTGHDPCNTAQFKDGQIVKYFMTLCKKLKIYLTVPYIEKAKNPNYIPPKLDNNNDDTKDDSKQNENKNDYPPIMEDEDIEFLYYNSITLINPSGNVCGHYRKTNLWPSYDNSWATQGDKIVTVDTEYGKIGLGICFDIHKILKEYKEENIWCLLYCIAWVSKVGLFPEDEATFRWFNIILPERLKKMEIPYYIVGANWSIDKKMKENPFLNDGNGKNVKDESKKKLKWVGYGHSPIYGPRGVILKQSHRNKRYGNDIVYADIPYKVQQN